MQAIQQKLRSEYDGEFVLTRTTIRDSLKDQHREWVENPIVNQHISGRAAVLGSDTDHMELFDYKHLLRHRGGLLGSKRLQTYGCNKVWKVMPVQFYVSTNQEDLAEIQETEYYQDNIVYTSTGTVLKNPQQFYLVPHSPFVSDLALAVYLAAFDSHQEIFLLGYNKDVNVNDANWIGDVSKVIGTYAQTKFWLVGMLGKISRTLNTWITDTLSVIAIYEVYRL